MHILQSSGKLEGTGDRDDDDVYEYSSVLGINILENMESLLQIIEAQNGVTPTLESIIRNIIHTIFSRNLSVFFEETFDFITALTMPKISAEMWIIFDHLYPVMRADEYDCFTGIFFQFLYK